MSVETYTTVVEAPAKKYRPGPKSRKRFLEIKDDLSGEASPNKRAKCDPQLEAFVKVLSIKARTGERPLAEEISLLSFSLLQILSRVKLEAEIGGVGVWARGAQGRGPRGWAQADSDPRA